MDCHRPLGIRSEVDALSETNYGMFNTLFVEKMGQAENQSFDTTKRMNEGYKNYSYVVHYVPVKVLHVIFLHVACRR